MTANGTKPESPPLLDIIQQDDGNTQIKFSGNWNLRNLTSIQTFRRKIQEFASKKNVQWNMDSVDVLDNAAALIIWQAWREQLP